MFFDDNTLTPSASGENCYDTDLAFATPYVKTILSDFIEATPHSDANNNWENAFDKAFSYLEQSSGDRRKKIWIDVQYTCTSIVHCSNHCLLQRNLSFFSRTASFDRSTQTSLQHFCRGTKSEQTTTPSSSPTTSTPPVRCFHPDNLKHCKEFVFNLDR